MALNIGYAQTAITPSLDRPVFLAGFGQNRRAVSVHDDLFARALSVSDGQMTLVLCALDLIGYFRPDALAVARRVHETAPGVALIVASTHTHHGPDTMGLWGPDGRTRGVDPVYTAEISEKIAATVVKSLEQPQPALLKAAAVHVPEFVKNYRDPAIVDDELVVVQFVGLADHLPRATLANYPCHPEVLWNQNPIITSDYVHFLREEVEAQTGAPCLFFSGALGGMLSPNFPDDQRTFASAEVMGRGIAHAGLEALEQSTASEPAIDAQKQLITPKLTNILYKLAFRRKLLPDVRDPEGRILTEVNLVKLGDVWFATVPGELLPKLGLALKADLVRAGARVAGIIGLANDELGYILPVEDFKYPWNPFRPGAHYEETNSIGKEIGPKVMEALRGML